MATTCQPGHCLPVESLAYISCMHCHCVLQHHWVLQQSTPSPCYSTTTPMHLSHTLHPSQHTSQPLQQCTLVASMLDRQDWFQLLTSSSCRYNCLSTSQVTPTTAGHTMPYVPLKTPMPCVPLKPQCRTYHSNPNALYQRSHNLQYHTHRKEHSAFLTCIYMQWLRTVALLNCRQHCNWWSDNQRVQQQHRQGQSDKKEREQL
jgi:hypothetical protein